jgi:DNA-binding MarR family transcriptional regulator
MPPSDLLDTAGRKPRLEPASYVRRLLGPDDRRATGVAPMPASLVLRDQAERIREDLGRRTVGGMTADEQRAALRALHRLEDILMAHKPDHERDTGRYRH